MPQPPFSTPDAAAAPTASRLRTSTAPPPFEPSWFNTVFLVVHPPPLWPRRFAIVTAHNPQGVVASTEDNLRFEKELGRFLASQGLAAFEVTGASRDLAHRECGRGFETGSITEAATVAARFRQKGFFWVEDGEVFIAVDGTGEVWRMDRWSERLRTCP